jgi:ethanolamine permease
VTLGTLPGFLIGCFDAYQSIFSLMYSVLALGVMINVVSGAGRKWEPVWWIIIYASYMVMHIIGGRWMWRALRVLSVGSMCILLIYLLGSIKFADFQKYAPLSYPPGLTGGDRYFQGGIDLFLKILPVCCWFFVGMESVNLASHETVDPKRDVPRAYLSAFLTVLCTSAACVLVGASIYPGATFLPLYLNPTSLGYMHIFDIDYRRATCLSLPAIYTAGFGFTYYYGSQVRAMGKSGLANFWLGYDVPGFKTPVPALLFGFVVGYCVGLRYYFFEILPHEDLLSISLLGATATYCSQFFSFIVFRLHYSSIKREFTSPLGIAGAVYGLLVFLLTFIVIAGFEKSPAIEIFAVYVGILIVYYFAVVQKRQVFSEEERTVLFKAYLIKSKSVSVLSKSETSLVTACLASPTANRSKNARMRSGQTRSQKLQQSAAGEGSPAASTPLRSKPSPGGGGGGGSGSPYIIADTSDVFGEASTDTDQSAARLSGKYSARGPQRILPIAEEGPDDADTEVLAAVLATHTPTPTHTETIGAAIELQPIRAEHSSALADLLPDTISVVD